VVCGDLRLIDVASGTTAPVDLGDVDASRAVWLDEDRLLVFGRRGLASVALGVTASGIVREVWTTDGSVASHHQRRSVRRRIAVFTSSHRRPPSIVVVDREEPARGRRPRHAGHDVVLGRSDGGGGAGSPPTARSRIAHTAARRGAALLVLDARRSDRL
jgi:hypothetical protein